MLQVLEDAKRKPLLFVWNGPQDRSAVHNRLVAGGWKVPDDLLAFWMETGGGDVFETEEILCPTREEFDSMMETLQARGLSTRWLVFHVGLGVSAVRQPSGDIVVLDSTSLTPLETYATFDAWYCGYVRREYGARYGLP